MGKEKVNNQACEEYRCPSYQPVFWDKLLL